MPPLPPSRRCRRSVDHTAMPAHLNSLQLPGNAHCSKHTPFTCGLQVDTGLSPLQAVQEWAAEGNPPPQRVAHILSIPAAAAESSLDECREVLIPLLSQLAFDDHPDIKQATAEVLGPLGEAPPPPPHFRCRQP